MRNANHLILCILFLSCAVLLSVASIWAQNLETLPHYRPQQAVSGTIRETGEISVVDCGVDVLVRGDTLPGVTEGDQVSFTIASDGRAYLIPTRG